MPLVRRVVLLCGTASLLLMPRDIAAQEHARSTKVAMSLRVLAMASFEGGMEHPLSTVVIGGASVRVDPTDGMQTRMTSDAPARVVVAGSPLIGPGGATIAVKYLCAIGAGPAVFAFASFDCEGGTLATLRRGGTTAASIAVGAEWAARETVDLCPGVYTGRVTLTAVHPSY